MASAAEFTFDPVSGVVVTDQVKKAFDEWGFILVRDLLSHEEIDALKETLETDEKFERHAYGRDDTMGRKAKVSLWNHPGDDITGALSRSDKVATTFEQLLGGEVYHYHGKVIMKDAFEGGSHLWHQDYGYWYKNGCLWPNMGTVWIAVDRATKENGCLRIIPKSHRLGRVNHVRVGDQAGADMTRVNQILAVMGEEVAMEMNPGDALFFHCNILHTSAQNHSPHRRWAFLVAYNRADNNPVYEHHHPQYTPLHKIPNSEILKYRAKPHGDASNMDFFQGVSMDVSIRELERSE